MSRPVPIYNNDTIMKTCQINRSYTFELSVYIDGSQDVLSDVSVVVYGSDGNELVDTDGTDFPSTSCDIDENGTASFSLVGSSYFPTVDSDEDQRCFVIWTAIDSNDSVWEFYEFFNITKYHFYVLIKDSDLTQRDFELSNIRPSGWSNYSGIIEEACGDVYDDFRNFRIDQPELIMTDNRLRTLQIYKTMELIYFQFSNEIDDKYWTLGKKYESRYWDSFHSFMNTLPIDSNESGNIDDSEKDESAGGNSGRVMA